MIVNPIVVSAGGKTKKDPGLKVDKKNVGVGGLPGNPSTVVVTRAGEGKIYPSAASLDYSTCVDGMNVKVCAPTRPKNYGDVTLTILLEETEEYAAAKAEVTIFWDGAIIT